MMLRRVAQIASSGVPIVSGLTAESHFRIRHGAAEVSGAEYVSNKIVPQELHCEISLVTDLP